MEKTIAMIKPDGIQRKLMGEIIKRIEERGLEVVKIKIDKLNKHKISELYKESLIKFPQIKEKVIKYMTEKPSLIMIIEGEDAISKVREIRGLSDPSKSPLGSVRRDFAGDQKMEELTKEGKVTKNIMHSSGTKEEVQFEIKLLFEEDEI